MSQPRWSAALPGTNVHNGSVGKQGSNASEIINAVSITQVWTSLGGLQPQSGRAAAFYRDGSNSQAVSLNDEKGCWFDHRDGVGGGVLDLIQRVLGCDRAAALHWLAELTGIPLDEGPTSRSERRDLAEQRARMRAEARAAEYFRLAAIHMSELLLSDLPADAPGRYAPTQLLRELKPAKGEALSAVYREFLDRNPALTAALVHAGERAWRRTCTRLARFVAAGMEVGDAA